MGEMTKVEIPVLMATAEALKDPERLEEIGRMVDRMIRRQDHVDPLLAAFDAFAAEAAAGGLTEADIEEELRVYNTERRV